MKLDQSGAGEFGECAKDARVSCMEAGIGAWERGEEVAVGDGINCTSAGFFEELKETTGAKGEIEGVVGMAGDEWTRGMASRIGGG